MEKRYQVFVSSTFDDLKKERKTIIEMLLNAKYIPSGMELFSASNDEQFKYIQKIMDNCDYYILVIGARYGSTNPENGLSFTELEYDYAISKNIPVLAFLHENPDELPPEKIEVDKKEELDRFKKKVYKNRMCKMWSNETELATSVIISLIDEISENPQLGWIRGSLFDTTELLSQINELRKEKDELENTIEKQQSIIVANSVKVDKLASGNDKFIIIGDEYINHLNKYEELKAELSWDEIFSAIGPHLFSPLDYYYFKINFKDAINAAYNTNFDHINDNSIQTIKIQFNALGLISITSEADVKGGVQEFIKITQKGENHLLSIKSIKK